MSKRHPAIVVTELKDKIAAANSMFVPVNIREGLELASEFMDSVSDVLVQSALIGDPANPDAEPPAPVSAAALNALTEHVVALTAELSSLKQYLQQEGLYTPPAAPAPAPAEAPAPAPAG